MDRITKDVQKMQKTAQGIKRTCSTAIQGQVVLPKSEMAGRDQPSREPEGELTVELGPLSPAQAGALSIGHC